MTREKTTQGFQVTLVISGHRATAKSSNKCVYLVIRKAGVGTVTASFISMIMMRKTDCYLCTMESGESLSCPKNTFNQLKPIPLLV